MRGSWDRDEKRADISGSHYIACGRIYGRYTTFIEDNIPAQSGLLACTYVLYSWVYHSTVQYMRHDWITLDNISAFRHGRMVVSPNHL
jgi:hypothetical protein